MIRNPMLPAWSKEQIKERLNAGTVGVLWIQDKEGNHPDVPFMFSVDLSQFEEFSRYLKSPYSLNECIAVYREKTGATGELTFYTAP